MSERRANLDTTRTMDFAHVRVPGWIAGENNSSLLRIEGSSQRGLIRSMCDVAALGPFELHVLAQLRAFVFGPKQTTRL